MKTLLLPLLLLCAGVLAPLANAQMCDNEYINCDTEQYCRQCHDASQYCYIIGCYFCATACPYIEGVTATLTHKPKPFHRDPLTDLGHAVLAATMPSVLRNPTQGKMPSGHPAIPQSYWTKTLARAKKPVGCKAPVSVQVLAVSMLRK